MMRNYLRQKLREDNFITCTSDGVPSSAVGRLCIDDKWPSSDLEIDWHHIRSLVIFEDAERVPYKHLQHLRVLDAQTYTTDGALENQHINDMCGLLRLRHLSLVPAEVDRHPVVRLLKITEMPAEIARLQYLETLEVRKTGIRRLPAEIGDLKQLKTLDVSWNKKLAELPWEMGNLQHLETLLICQANIREQAWEIIGKLKNLKTLDVSDNHELSGVPRDIGELQQLKNLDVRNNRGIKELPKEIRKLLSLETLNLNWTRIEELPREIGNLQRLQILDLGEVSTITKLPRDIGRLQHLEELNLSGTEVRKMPKEIGELKKLKNLNAEFGTLPFEAGQLSKLEGLPKCIRRAWKNSDLVSSLAEKILSFDTTGSIGDGGLTVGTKQMHIPKWIKEHFNNIGSLDIRICKLDEEQDLKILREMPYLMDLTLRFEAVPRKPIVISSGGFAKLQYLSVDSRSVPRVTFQEGAMPGLQKLYFGFQFYGGPPNTDPPMGIKHLMKLEWVIFECSKWYRGDSSCISVMIDVVKKEARQHPNIQFTLRAGDQVWDEIEQGSHGSNEASNEASSSEASNEASSSEASSNEASSSEASSNEASSSEANENEEIQEA